MAPDPATYSVARHHLQTVVSADELSCDLALQKTPAWLVLNRDVIKGLMATHYRSSLTAEAKGYPNYLSWE